MATTGPTVDERVAADVLAEPRLAVVGASPAKGNFGAAIARSLRDRGTDVVVVHPSAAPIDGIPAYVDLAAVPGDLGAAIVVVPAAAAAEVVRACADRGIAKVWLFRGLGGAGAVSQEALAVAAERGISVVPGACPLMFLEPVGWFHRIHRAARRRRGAVAA